jgi:D-alanyl-D-alanine carboxypeptidase/D-alanyl-D-alanine-endopeptidase (penicillin-binding protein 4)
MRRAHVVGLALVAAASLTGAAPSRAGSADLHSALARALRAPGIDAHKTAALAIDLRTGATVYARNAHISLLPASTEKLAVSLTALRVLGPDFRFRTEVVGAGSRSGRVWNGNLWLVGFGDPTLGRADLERLARRFAATGIKKVAGRVLGDDSHFDARRDAPGWKPSYLGIESSPLSALAVAGVRFDDANGSAAAAAKAYADALERHGVAVLGGSGAGHAPAHTLTIAFDLSHRLASVLHLVDAESDNFAAEMLLKELGSTVGDRGSTAAGVRVIRSTLVEAGVPLAGVRMADGSGLSRFDRSTALSLAAILRAGVSDPTLRTAFLASLAVAGVSGTLEDRLGTRPTKGHVLGKTGTTNRASALVGVVRGRYVFAILQNGAPVPWWTARAAQDRFVTALAGS